MWPRSCIRGAYSRLRSGAQQLGADFRLGQRLKIHVSDQVVLSGMMLAIHSVHENILVQGESRARPPVAVTNVYLRTATVGE